MSDKMINRIAALLAKANDKATTEEEGKSYLAKAAELMEIHQIKEAELRGVDPSAQAKGRVESKVYHVSNKASRGKDRTIALNLVIKAMGGKTVYLDYGRTDIPVRLTVLATVGTLEMLDLLIPVLLEQMEYHTNKASRAYVKELIGFGVMKARAYALSPKFRRDFTIGYGIGVSEKIEAARNAQEASAGALVLVGDRKRVEEEYAERYAHVRPARKTRRKVSANALYKGAEQGRKANLHTTAAL